MKERIWGNYRLRERITVGGAGRRNAGHRTGKKVHYLEIEEIVGLVDEEKEREECAKYNKRTLGLRFMLTGEPQVFSVSPACGCCQGQWAGTEYAGEVTCEKCLKFGADYAEKRMNGVVAS